jgi:hypothetical protein
MLLRQRASLLAVLALTLLTVGSVSAKAQKQGADNPDVVEIVHYHLNTPKLDQFIAATNALAKLVDANPDLKKSMNAGSDNDESLTQKAADWDLHFPQATAVVKSAGLSTREYLVISIALFNDVMIVGMKKQGTIKEYPPDAITAENAAFVEQNYDKIEQALSPLMKSANPDANSQ